MNADTEHSPPPQITADTLKKIMWLYRTRTCPLNKRGQCNYGVHCFDSHEPQPERRAPKQNEYNDWHPSTMKCTSSADESCKYGRACYFAHNDFEVNYHPTMYKTNLCLQFEKDGYCGLGMICHSYHYPAEQRKIEKGALSTDSKTDGVSRKAPPPQEFRRWLDEEHRKHKNLRDSATGSSLMANGHNNNKLLSDNVDAVVDMVIDGGLATNLLPHNDVIHVPPVNVAETNLKLGGEFTRDNKVANEVEMELPKATDAVLNNSHNAHALLPGHGVSGGSGPPLNLAHLMDDSPSTRFISASGGSSPYTHGEPIEEKWHPRFNNNNQSRPEHYIPAVPSPHLNRAVSTPDNLNHVNMAGPAPIVHSHSHHNYGQRAASTTSHVSQSSHPSVKSPKSHKSSGSKHSKKSKSKSLSKSRKIKKKDKASKKRERRERKASKKRERTLKQKSNNEKAAMELINRYKVNRCTKSNNAAANGGKCVDLHCDSYHNLSDRRRSPLSFNYIGEPCQRIFDNKTRKFTDNCYGCPANEQCEYAHNYLEIWYHPLNFHSKPCPIQKYNKNCCWGFKCTHYHKKSQRRTQKFSPLSSSHSHSHSHSHHTASLHGQYSPVQPQHVQHVQQPQFAHNHNPSGPHRPPLTTNRANSKQIHVQSQAEMGSLSPYSNSAHSVPYHNEVQTHHHNVQLQAQGPVQTHPHHHFAHVMQNQMQNPQNQVNNGLMSPHFDSNKSSPHNLHNDGSYSYNPLMQGIAPSINSWRQKIDKHVGY